MAKEIYDVLTGEIISDRDIDISKRFNFHKTTVSNLRRGKCKTIFERFCLLENKDTLVFKLKNLTTNKIYECLTNSTIYLHLNIPYSRNSGDCICGLVKKKMKVCSIGDYIFCLFGMEGEVKTKNLEHSKNAHLFQDKINEHKELAKIQSSIRNILACRIRQVLKFSRMKKTKSTEDLIGCSFSKFCNHLENQFLPGMTWENRGVINNGWHIDHIRPCNTFDLTNEEEQKRCFHYTNLRPLWAQDNFQRPRDGRDMFGYGLDI